MLDITPDKEPVRKMYEKLYKTDSKKKIRVWWMEQDGFEYRTHSGLVDGKITISKWFVAKPKNVGKANATTAEQQATVEVEAKYTKQREQGQYYGTLEEALANVPTYFDPMLAQKFDEAKQNYPCIVQPKLDGVRCVATKEGLFSRNGKPLVSTPHIADDLDAWFEKYPDSVLDGELYTHKFRDDFETIISLCRKSKPTEEDLENSKLMIQYHIYDTYSKEPYMDRMVVVNDYVTNAMSNSLMVVQTFTVDDKAQIDEYYSTFMSDGFEGLMVRDPKMPYEQKRSKALKKLKEFVDEEFEVVSINEGQGNWRDKAKSITIRFPDGRTQDSGIKGNFLFAEQLLQNKEQYEGGQVTVRYQNLTTDGYLRFPIAVAFYPDKRDM